MAVKKPLALGILAYCFLWQSPAFAEDYLQCTAPKSAEWYFPKTISFSHESKKLKDIKTDGFVDGYLKHRNGKFRFTPQNAWRGSTTLRRTYRNYMNLTDFALSLTLEDVSKSSGSLRARIEGSTTLYPCVRFDPSAIVAKSVDKQTADETRIAMEAKLASLASVEAEARKKLDSLIQSEFEAKARAEALAKTEAEVKARAEALAKTAAEEKAKLVLTADQPSPQRQVRVTQQSSVQSQPQPQQLQTQVIPQVAVNISSSDPKEAIEEIDLKITLYAKIANNLPQTEAVYRVQQEVLDKKIEELRKVRESLAASYLAKYNTPIYPVNINLGTTAFRYSEIFPSIPYYIPGTKEVGEFLVQPVVSNKGQLTYEFTFLDPSAKYNKEREQIVVVNTDMGTLIDGLDKVREWTETAEKQNVRRRFEKVASCFPQNDCGERQVGKSSTEVVFQIYENGSTSGKLQRVKGEFVSGYNMSVESTVLLGAYLKYMRDIGEQEFKVGSMTEKDLDSLFK